MVREIVKFSVREGQEEAFAAAFRETETLFRESKGCHGVELLRGLERPSEFWLVVDWGTMENHTVDFARSEAAGKLGALIGPHLAAAPALAHGERVVAFAL